MNGNKVTEEEMEARGILDNDSLYDGPAEYSDPILFLEDAAELAKETNRAAAGYGFTKNGAILFLCWAFYQMGVWRGSEEYRGFLIERINDELDFPELPDSVKDLPFQMNEGGVAGIVAALDCDDAAKKILPLFQLDIWKDKPEVGRFEDIACARDEDIIAREILFGLTDGIVEG